MKKKNYCHPQSCWTFIAPQELVCISTDIEDFDYEEIEI